jgi:hypothetical protein
MKELAKIGAIPAPSFHQYLPRKGRETVHSGLTRKLHASRDRTKGMPMGEPPAMPGKS